MNQENLFCPGFLFFSGGFHLLCSKKNFNIKKKNNNPEVSDNGENILL